MLISQLPKCLLPQCLLLRYLLCQNVYSQSIHCAKLSIQKKKQNDWKINLNVLGHNSCHLTYFDIHVLVYRMHFGRSRYSGSRHYQSPLILTELFQHNLINVSYLTACYLYQVMMTLHFLNDVANDAESTQTSEITS